MRSLWSIKWLDSHRSILATALAAEACARGYRVRFFRTTELVTALIEARNELSFLRLKAQLARLDLLVLDELGYVPASKVGAELLFDVISTAYERTSLIVTSNLPFELWTEVLGSERLTGATLDRLTHRCRIIETKGESYRLHDAKSRARRPRPKHEEPIAQEAAADVNEPAAEVVPEPVDNSQAAV
jgi:DNA replication protein DnaC